MSVISGVPMFTAWLISMFGSIEVVAPCVFYPWLALAGISACRTQRLCGDNLSCACFSIQLSLGKVYTGSLDWLTRGTVTDILQVKFFDFLCTLRQLHDSCCSMRLYCYVRVSSLWIYILGIVVRRSHFFPCLIYMRVVSWLYPFGCLGVFVSAYFAWSPITIADRKWGCWFQ